MSLHVPVSLLLSIAICGVMVIPVYLVLLVFKQATKGRKSPLNIELLRSPGQSLRDDILEKTVDIIGNLMMVPLVVSVLYGLDLTNRHFFPDNESSFTTFVYVLAGLGICTYTIVKIYRLISLRNKLRLGYECEVAVGQDLDQLMRQGFNVYHDFSADGFNIDHIAVGSTGVYAVETKGRSKQVNAEKDNWKLYFDGESLKFPTHTESAPVSQARNQAQWLSRWIESATGEPQPVIPVLAIPGWFINRMKPSNVRVYNGKGSPSIVKGPNVLSDIRIKAISYQIENRCRDVKSQSYKKE